MTRLRDRPLRAATRGSPLARAQTDRGRPAEPPAGSTVEPVVVDTQGDRQTDVPIWELGGRGVFVKEVQAAVLDGRADFAVHSAKDLPSSPPEGLRHRRRAPQRGDPRDALVGATLRRPARRRPHRHRLGPPAGPAGLAAPGPHLRRAAGEHRDPAVQGRRLRGHRGGRRRPATGWAARPTSPRSSTPSVMVPQVGQGALAVECRADDDDTLAAPGRHRARAVARGRSTPSGPGWPRSAAAATCRSAPTPPSTTAGRITLTAMIGTPDGRIVLRDTDEGDDPVDARPPPGPPPPRRRRRPSLLADLRCHGPRAPGRRSGDGARADRARDRLPGRRGAGRPRAAHPCGAPSCWPGPTWSCTTGCRRSRCSTWRRPRAERIDVGKSPGAPVAQEDINALLVERGQRGPGGGAAQGRRPVRVRPGRRGGPGPGRGRACRSRSFPGSRRRWPCPPTPASR